MSSPRHIEWQCDHKLGVHGQVSRLFGQNRRMTAIVATPTEIYLLISGNHEREVSMYQLHYFPANANAAPQMLLEEISVKYGLVLVDRAKNAQKSREYLKINPSGRIPAQASTSSGPFSTNAPSGADDTDRQAGTPSRDDYSNAFDI
jgi:hypothetical protein